MQLKRLEIAGFKSFAKKTSLDFLYNMTAIVGPNGVGKSNVVDAIRWVLGEQSIKSLRGKKGEDLIFNGSSLKSKLGQAEVTLFFDNQDRSLPVDYSEVAISRRISRDGENQYLLNNKHVRLSDIEELLTKSRIGNSQFVVITQGTGDMFLNFSPLERLRFLEEVAGVKEFQWKKDKAERKLRSTKENLRRINDLIVEIMPRLNYLKKQANKARKREVKIDELKELKEKLYNFLLYSINQKKKEISSVSDDLRKKEEAFKEQINELKIRIEKEREKVYDDEKEYRNYQDMIQVLRTEINKLEKESAIYEGRLSAEKEREKNNDYIRVDLGYVKERLKSLYRSLRHSLESENLHKEVESVIREFENVMRDIEKGKALKQWKKEEKHTLSKELEAKADAIKKSIEALENKLRPIESKIKELSRDEWGLRDEVIALEKELHDKEDMISALYKTIQEQNFDMERIKMKEAEIEDQFTRSGIMKRDLNPEERAAIDEEDLRHKIYKCERFLDQAGGIDESVIEEYEDVRRRHEFLTRQELDLKTAVSSLHALVKELSFKIKNLFNESLTNINNEFNRYFRLVFGGGRAFLVKKRINNERFKVTESSSSVDSEEERELPKEGIEIRVELEGKKLASLNMLSGGERVLVTLALLFGIVSTNPPPFLVLDEIDAFLDEKNSQKFMKIIRDLSKGTQFMIVTHNRETMRQADLLYGVTIKDGVSQLLSLKLEDVHKA